MIRSLAVIAAILAVAFPAAHAHAWCQMTTSNMSPTPSDPCPSTGLPLHWTRACISYAIDQQPSLDLADAAVRQQASLAFDAWTSAACPGGGDIGFQLEQIAAPADCNRDQFNSNGGNVNVIAFVRDWAARGLEGADQIFALTTVWHNRNTGEILDVDMLINEQQGPYAVCPDAGCTATANGKTPVDLRNVMTHEAGHFFGMAHTNLAISGLPLDQVPTMYAASPRGVTFMRTLASDDIDGICSIYPPGTITGTCASDADFAPIGGLDLNCTDNGGGRCSIARNASEPADAAAGWGVAVVAAVLFTRRKRLV